RGDPAAEPHLPQCGNQAFLAVCRNRDGRVGVAGRPLLLPALGSRQIGHALNDAAQCAHVRTPSQCRESADRLRRAGARTSIGLVTDDAGRWRLMAMADGFLTTQLLYVAARLGLADE